MDVLPGKHDQEIFECVAGAGGVSGGAKEELKDKINTFAVRIIPFPSVLTDHGPAQVALVLRETVSLKEIAADLTCEPEDFEPATSPDDDLHEAHHPQSHIRPTPARSR